ncbi:hypothetical protein ACO0LD_18730 [Undibacterium sp. Ji83W]|uniref:hypothetical protein n=1 Tax=Undibacterium sp. Ji83W TaxID=3413043 RepID=UPI003BF42507
MTTKKDRCTPSLFPVPARPNTANLTRLFFTLFCFSFTSTAFAFAPSTGLEELIVAAVGSFLFSVIAMIVIFVKLKKNFLPRLLIALASPLLVFPVCMGGSMGTSYVMHEISQSKKNYDIAQVAQDEQGNWQRNLLRISACDGDRAVLETELASGRHDFETKKRVLEECVLPKADAIAMRAMLTDLLAQNAGDNAYCSYLNPVLQRMDTGLLDVFLEQKLSLTCPSTRYAYAGIAKNAPSWWEIFPDGQAADADQLLNTLRYLQAHGVEMKMVVDGRSLLSLAMLSGKAELILYALDAGVDPYAIPADTSMLSPQQSWTLQRFSFPDMGTYTEADKKRIQSRLRDMNGKEAESLAHRLRIKGGLESATDGGAGLLAYLIQSGANLRRLNQDGNGVMSAYTHVSPAVVEVLNKLSDQQLKDFICPEAGEYDDGYQLYAEAINGDNQPLVNLLKQRNMPATCPDTKKKE